MPAYSIRRGPTLPANPRNGKVFVLTEGADQGLYVCVDDGEWTGPLSAGGAGGPATEIEESSGPTTLAIGAVADGEFLKREGSTVVGAAAGGASYLVYTALLTQTGTDAPVATVLQNTLGGTVVWTRAGAGQYAGTLLGAFTANKTVCFITAGDIDLNGPNGAWLEAFRSTDNVVYIQSRGNDGGTPIFADWNDNAPVSIEIRVYP